MEAPSTTSAQTVTPWPTIPATFSRVQPTPRPLRREISGFDHATQPPSSHFCFPRSSSSSSCPCHAVVLSILFPFSSYQRARRVPMLPISLSMHQSLRLHLSYSVQHPYRPLVTLCLSFYASFMRVYVNLPSCVSLVPDIYSIRPPVSA